MLVVFCVVMPGVLAVVVALLLLAPTTLCLHLGPSDTSPSNKQLQLPRYALASDDEDDQTPLQSDFDSNRLHRALRALLELNDGELQALMAGVPPREVASRLSPSTAFFLASSRHYLERLNTILATTSSNSLQDSSTPSPSDLTWNPRISRRRRRNKSRSAAGSHRHPHQDRGRSTTEDSDNVLEALSELSSYLAGGEEGEDRGIKRSRRSHHGRGHKHKTLQTQGSSQYEAHHYLYFLRTRGKSMLHVMSSLFILFYDMTCTPV